MILPVETWVIGQHIGKLKIGELHKAITTPDGRNVINVILRSDSTLVLTNPNQTNFSFNLTTKINDEEEIILACVMYDSEGNYIIINDAWLISSSFIENKLTDWKKNVEEKVPIINIALNGKQFKQLGPKMSFSPVTMRFDEGPLVQIGFTRDKLAFVASDQ